MAKVLLVIALEYEPTPSPFPFVSLINWEYRHSNEVLLPKIFSKTHKIYQYLASPPKNLVKRNNNLCQHCTNVMSVQVSQICQEVRNKSVDLTLFQSNKVGVDTQQNWSTRVHIVTKSTSVTSTGEKRGRMRTIRNQNKNQDNQDLINKWYIGKV